jgi:hypothetical protein
MKNSSYLKAMLGMAMMMEGQGNVHSNRPNINYSGKSPKPIVPFAEQPAIKELIREYKDIQALTCLKSSRKQARTEAKILQWLESGHLTKEDLK